jgi:Zn-finger nucleic acid-binding protein
VALDKLEYLACINGCEGVWVSRGALEKFWGKKKLKVIESELEEAKQPDFEDDILEVDKDPLEFEDELEDEDEELFADEDEEDIEDFEEDDVDEDDEDDIDDEDEVEEVNFGNQRGLRISFINEEGEYDDPVNDSAEGYGDATELIEDEEEESIQIEDEEAFFLTSPVSGNPMKRLTYPLRDKIGCSIGWCSESESYWIDGSEEVLAIVSENKRPPRHFSDLLAFDRPEEEVFEEEEEEEEL